MGYRGGINVYAYGPNPIEWVDPLGLAGNRANRRAGSILRDMDSSGGGHAYARHGAGTTMAQQEHRAKTGIPPTIRVLNVRGLSIQLDSLATSTNWMQFSEVLR
ncbi:hypothetical protein DF051_38975 [Burkholderia contaminans]|uniref:RHS repeat-associated core domain-containing protein n=1 Tax=Burkholderia contaminans TaxID=488447 RepID=A0A3N8NTS6_9BURK|nr:hypothetical protein DF051_38975 [Burkholderia contaminans]